MSDVLSFDISKKPKGNPITYGRVGDANGLTRKVKIYDDGKPLNLEGYVITFEGITSKFKTKVFDSDGVTVISAEKGEFNYTFPAAAFSGTGAYELAYFSFMKDEIRLTTADFQVIVFGNSDIEADDAEAIITEYNRLVVELNLAFKAAVEKMDGTYEDLDKRAAELDKKLADILANVEKYRGPQGDIGPIGPSGINASGQLVFNNRFDRWSLDLTSDENLALAGWTKPAYFQVIDPETDKPANRIASMLPRTSTTQFWSTGIAVVPGTYVKWRGQVRSNEVVTNSIAIFAVSRFFAADVPDITNSAAASQLDGTNETTVYLRANGTVAASKPAAVNVVSSSGVTFDEANKWYDFEVVIEVPEGAAWLKLSAYAAPTVSATQVFSYRDYTAVAYQKGDSAYQVWLNDGNTGTESDFLSSLKVGYTKAESDAKYATKASVLPTATDAEAITGTATNKLITPKNLQTFYEDRQKISVARFGLSDLDSTSVDKFTEASWRYRRTGSQVDFFGRFNFKVAGDSFSTIQNLPVGFRLSADFDDTSWNVPLSTAKFSALSTYDAAGFVERIGTNLLKIASSATGNVYFYGRWYTDDPFPLG